MQDRNEILKDGFWSYSEVCKVAKMFGYVPEENPPEAKIQKLKQIINRCLLHYRPVPGELELVGVYLYREEYQPAGYDCTYGITQDIGGGKAIICLSLGLLSYNMPVFHDLVFLHECCHLYAMNHGERFQDRFNEVEFDYYFYNEARFDGAIPKPKRKGWKM